MTAVWTCPVCRATARACGDALARWRTDHIDQHRTERAA